MTETSFSMARASGSSTVQLGEIKVPQSKVTTFPADKSLKGAYSMLIPLKGEGDDRWKLRAQPVEVHVPAGTDFVHLSITGVMTWFDNPAGEPIGRPLNAVIFDTIQDQVVVDGTWRFILTGLLADDQLTSDWTMEVRVDLLFLG